MRKLKKDDEYNNNWGSWANGLKRYFDNVNEEFVKTNMNK